MSLQIAQTAGLVSVNTTSTAKSVDLPLTSQRQGRVITIKDAYGFANVNAITVNCTGGNTFEDGTTSYVINKQFGSVTFVAKGSQWIKTSESSQGLPSTLDGLATFGYISSLSLQSSMIGLNKSFITSSLTVSSISFGNDFGFLNLGDVQADTLSANRIYASTAQLDGALSIYDRQLLNYGIITLSNTTLYINGNPITAGGGSGDVTSTNLTSTTLGLGTLGYLSSFGSISSLAVSTGQSYTGQGVFSSIHVNMTPEDAPVFDSNSFPVFGSNYPGDPLAVDIFGSLRVLKNIYVGSTTTVIGTLGVQGKIMSTTQITASSIGMFNPATGGVKFLTLDATGGLSLAGQPIQASVVSTFSNLFANTFTISTITMNDVATPAQQKDFVLSNGTLYIGNVPVASGGGGGGDVVSTQLFSTTVGITSNFGVALGSTIVNLGGFGYLSSATNLVSTPFLNSSLVSTIVGLGSAGYLSSASGLVSTFTLASSLQSTTIGLQTLISSFIDPTELTSTVVGLGTVNFISSLGLTSSFVSTTRGLGTLGYLSSATNLVSTPFLASSFVSTIVGLGSAGYLSSATNLVSTFTLASSLQSTTIGLQNLISTSYIDPTELTSTVIGLGTVNFVSSLGLTSSLMSTTAGLQNWVSSFYVDFPELTSTVRGLGTVGYLSSAANLVSTPFLNSSLVSTVQGLGLAGYISSTQFLSTTAAYRTTFTTTSAATSSLTASSITSVQGSISSLQVDVLTIGTGTGWINIGPIQATAISSIQENTGALYATTAFIGNTSTLNQIRFWGLFGNYNNTILAEVSTGTAVGAQEFLLFKGSSASDRIRFQTTGDIRFEPQVAAREFSTATALATPTMILQSNLVGIATATPVATLDVRGTAFATTLSTQQLAFSSFNGIAFSNLISTAVLQSSLQSTVTGLGTIGYLSSAANLVSTFTLASSLQSTTIGLQNLISTSYIDPTELTSTVVGLGTVNFISSLGLTSSFVSTTTGLATLGYLSSAANLVSTPFLASSFVSTIVGLGSAGYLSSATNLVSTFTLASSLQSTTIGLQNLISTSYIDPTELTSTVIGLGTVNYISSLQSTTLGLGTLGYLSSASLQSSMVGLNKSFVTSSLTVSSISFGNDFGFLNLGDVQTDTLSSVRIFTSTIQVDGAVRLYDRQLTNYGTITLSNQTLYINGNPITAGGTGSGDVTSTNLTSTTLGLGTLGYLSSASGLISTATLDSTLRSTVSGLNRITPSDYMTITRLNADQALTADSDTVIQFIDDYDPKSWYDATTYQFLPNVAGYYHMTYQVWFSGFVTSNNQANIQMRKNGATQAIGQEPENTVTGQTITVSKIVYFNGSTDYMDFSAYVGNASNTTTTALAGIIGQGTYFSAFLILSGANVAGASGSGSGDVVSTQLISTTGGLTSNLNSALNSTINGLATFRYLSSATNLVSTPLLESSLQSTVRGLGTIGYLSSLANVNLSNLVSTPFLASSFVSTIVGLGSAGYLSSANNLVSTFTLASSLQSTTIGLQNLISTSYIDPTELTSTVVGLGTVNFISSLGLTSSFVSTTRGLGTLGYLSSAANLVSTPFLASSFVSTIVGLGSAGYLSSATNLVSTPLLESSLQSTVRGLGTIGYLSSLANVNLSNLVSTPFLASSFVSTIVGLGSAGYLSSATNLVSTFTLASSLQSTTIGLQNLISTSYIDPVELTSTVIGLGTVNFVSSLGLTSSLMSTTTGLQNWVSTFYVDVPELTSTTRGLGNLGYLSSATNLVSTPFLASSFVSTIVGLGSAGYLSSATNLVSTFTLASSLQSTTIGLQNFISTSYIDSTELTSTVVGLGTLSYLSSATNLVSTPFLASSFVSTIVGLGSAGYLSSANNLVSSFTLASSLQSTTIGLQNLISTSYIDPVELTSTVIGLGTVNFVSSLGLTSSLISTTAGLQTWVSSFYVDPPELTSTTRGLGTIGYLSSYVSSFNFLSSGIFLTSSVVASLISTNFLLANNLFARSTNISSMYVSSLTGIRGYISSFQVDEIQFGDGTGWADFGPLRATYISSLQENTGALYATTAFIGNTSTLNQIRFWGLFGNYNNTILAEVSTGTAVGAQEFLIFKGSSASDRIRLQTTGDIRFEPQVAAREFSTATALATPTMILQSNLVGIATATPVATLDVRGTAFATTLSTSQLAFSSFNGIAFSNLISTAVLQSSLQSTVAGLATFGYLSSATNLVSTFTLASSLQSTTIGLQNLISTSYIDPLELTSTVIGLGTVNFVSSLGLTSSFISTTTGLGTLGYLSSAANLVSTPFLASSFVSTIVGLGSAGYLSSATNLVSTFTLASSLQSTTIGLQNLISTSYIDPVELTSTVIGLGTVNFVSSLGLTSSLMSTTTGLQNWVSTFYVDVPELTSTVRGLATSGYVSTTQLTSTTLGITSNYSTFLSTTLATYSFPYSGETLYFNYSVPQGTYSALSSSNIFGPSFSNVFVVGLNSSNNFVVGFQSDFNLPTFIPTGFWKVSLFSEATNTGVGVYASLFERTSGGVETLIATSSNSPQIVPLTKVSLDLTFDVPYRDLTTAASLVLKIFANNTANQDRTLTTYFENGNYSHVVTTLGTVAPTATTLSTIVGLGTFGYLSSATNLVSTPLLDSTLQSTVRGLGTFGYLSSATALVSTPFLDLTLQSTLNGLATFNYLSTATLQSSMIGLNKSLITSSLTVSSISFGNDFGFLNLGDVQTDTLSSVRIFTSTIQVDGSIFLRDKQLTTYGNITLSNGNLYINGVIVQGGGGSAGGDFSTAITSTTIGLGTFGYLSSAQSLVSTPFLNTALISINTAYTGNLSVNTLIAPTGNFIFASTGLTSVSSLSFFDATSAQLVNMRANDSYLYFSTHVIGGASVAQPQFITF